MSLTEELYFQYIGEIWRDITAIEFAMRAALAFHDKEDHLFPEPPYEVGKIYKNFPKAYGIRKFEELTENFNAVFDEYVVPENLVQTRHAMAHGLMASIDNSPAAKLIKFKQVKDAGLIIEFSQDMSDDYLKSARQEFSELRRKLFKLVNQLNPSL